MVHTTCDRHFAACLKQIIFLGKRDSSTCPCGHRHQDGHHIIFQCPAYRHARASLLQQRHTWEELDVDIYIKDKEDDKRYESTE